MRELSATEIDAVAGAGWFEDWTGPTECPPEIPRQYFVSLPTPQGEYIPELRSVLGAGATASAGPTVGGYPSIVFRPWKGGASYTLSIQNGLAVVGKLP
jgi:hypothetical protein